MARDGSETTPERRVGVWLLGAQGGLATTVMVGARFIARGLAGTTGLVTESEGFRDLGLAPIGGLVFGGHDIRSGTVFGNACEIDGENGTFGIDRLRRVKDDLDAIDGGLREGTAHQCGPAIQALVKKRPARRERPLDTIQRLQGDILDFKKRHALDTVVVVNVASTEVASAPEPRFESVRGMKDLLERGSRNLRASILYGYAAADLGCPFINFTPNRGSLAPAIQLLARDRGAPLMGNDGKTGETLVKSALAPMFKYRALRVLSWQGYNILGDRDGLVLSNPEHRRSKVASKDGVLSRILGYPLHTHVGIDYVPSLKDQKTAWDFVHFAGFLDYRMSLQFTWQGCDAILAAPLVLDMVRLAEVARRNGECGLMTQLACFFKSPVGVDEHDLHFQFHHLLDYLDSHRRGRSWPTGIVAKTGEIKVPSHRGAPGPAGR